MGKKTKFKSIRLKYLINPTPKMYREGVFDKLISAKKNKDLAEEEYLNFPDGYPRPSFVTNDYKQVAIAEVTDLGSPPLLDARSNPSNEKAKLIHETIKSSAIFTDKLPKPLTEPSYIYLLDKFDRNQTPLLSLPQGAIANCYACSASNYSLISLALSRLTSKNNSKEEIKRALEYGHSLAWSRPVLQYGNKKLTSYLSKTSGTLKQGGDFWTSVVGAKQYLVPETWISSPLIYNYFRAYSELAPRMLDITNPFHELGDGKSSSCIISIENEHWVNFAHLIHSQKKEPKSVTIRAFYLQMQAPIDAHVKLKIMNDSEVVAVAEVVVPKSKFYTHMVKFHLSKPLEMTILHKAKSLLLNKKRVKSLKAHIEVKQGSRVNILEDSLSVSFHLPSEALDIPALDDLLLEAWAKKLGVGMQERAAGFDTSSIYQLDELRMHQVDISSNPKVTKISPHQLPGTKALDYIRGVLSTGAPIPWRFNLFQNYVRASNNGNGIVAPKSSNPIAEGGMTMCS